MGCAPSTKNKVIQSHPQLQDKQEHQLENINYWEYLYDDSLSLLNYLINGENRSDDEDDLYLTENDKWVGRFAETSRTEYVEEYVDLLERFISLYEDYNGNIPINRFKTVGDPNKATFPLPKLVFSNRESLKHWLKNWEAFDCVVSDDSAWQMLGFLGIWCSEPIPVDQLYRGWYNGWSWTFAIDGEAAWEVLPLGVIKRDITTQNQEDIWFKRSKRTDLNDQAGMERRKEPISVDQLYRGWYNGWLWSFAIDGEAAWDVLPLGVIKRDILTPSQEVTWKQRSKRIALNDPARMDRRRKELANYFNRKYAETLEAGWMQFQDLC